MLYQQLLRAQIPKAQKDPDDLTINFYALLGSACVKASSKNVGEIEERDFANS